MSDKLRVGILGGTGMVGQRFITLLENHPWFEVVLVAASGRSAGKLYEDAVEGRWKMQTPMPEFVKKMTVYDMDKDFDEIVSKVDFVFCAVNMPKDQIRAIEERYAKAEVPVVSNNSANRWTPDVPMVVPEINPEHLEVIKYQRERLGTKRGFICVKPNCSIQSYTPALNALKEFGPKLVVATTYQAISGAGKTFEQWPEMVENIIPYIGGITTLEDKSLGCTQKSGSSLVKGVLAYAEPVNTKGLNLLSAPGNDLVAATACAASGAQMVLFTTGRGTPFASPVPTVKIATNSRLAGNKGNWIDFNAGRIVTDDLPLEDAAKELFQLVLDVASGKKVKAEIAGFHDLAIFKQGVTL